MMEQAWQHLNQVGLVALFHSSIYTYMIYCNYFWVCTYKSFLMTFARQTEQICKIDDMF